MITEKHTRVSNGPGRTSQGERPGAGAQAQLSERRSDVTASDAVAPGRPQGTVALAHRVWEAGIIRPPWVLRSLSLDDPAGP